MMTIELSRRIGALARLSRTMVRSRPPLRKASRLLLAVAITSVASPSIAQGRDHVRPAFEHALPNVPGKKMVAVVVSYPPGGKSLAHRHAASAFIYAYVLSGTIRSKVNDEPAKVYRTGEGFYEMPGAHHRISENASKTTPASLLAVFVVDSKDGALTTPDGKP